jgi:Dolichyl-phosphate-mannose-protein mannosyltransferase
MSRRRFIVAVALVVLAGGALRVALAAQRPLWIDEVYRLAWSHGCDVGDFDDVTSSMLCINKRPGSVADVLRVTAGFDPLPSLLLLNRWMHLSGARSDLAIRVPLVAFSVLGLVGMALLGRELGGVRLGLAAVTLVALSPLHVYYGAELNNYALACCLVIFSYLFYFACCATAAPETWRGTSSAPWPRC